MIDAALLAKFHRRAPLIASQAHLDKIMALFPVEHHEEIAIQIQPLLQPGRELTARKVEALPELKVQNPEAPSLHEDTILRLNNMAATIEQMKAEAQPLKNQVATLTGQIEAHVATIAALQTDQAALHEQLQERDAAIAKMSLEAAISREGTEKL